MLSRQENDALTKVGRGTPMGELMRRYWHPIAATAELDERPTKAVRLLGEDLVLYKDRSGTYGLIERLCPLLLQKRSAREIGFMMDANRPTMDEGLVNRRAWV